ncbi:MAG: hypothetical protein LH660_10320 [Phormidesmis sp. CAN_BIN36]|nr:hypothetical protein [Phormidesmis sp. CAN_BIN36]
MNWTSFALAAAIVGGSLGHTTISTAAEPSGENLPSPNANVPYLGVDGEYTLDTSVPSSRRDPRNPGRVEFSKAKRFSFYRDLKGRDIIVRNCPYVYRGARPDPFYYAQFPTSVWDLFELAPGNDRCSAFTYVALRSPHGSPIHMHVRYGGEKSSFDQLLKLSDSAEDTKKIDPWWSVYCAAGKTGCDL